MREFILAFLLVFFVISAGCISFEEETPAPTCTDPEKAVGGRCCFDNDDNGVCDIDEKECPESCDDNDRCTNDHCSLETNFECKNDKIEPCCGNGICEESEDAANECPEDCTVIAITGFYHKYSGPDYMEGDKFVFIHTGSNDTDKKPDFYINITATDMPLKNIRTTYNCTDSETGHKIDSINVDRIEVVEGYPLFGHENKFDSADYTIYTYFYSPDLKTRIDVDELIIGKTVEFAIRMNKKDFKVRSLLTCDFDFYFLEPLKKIRKTLKVSYI